MTNCFTTDPYDLTGKYVHSPIDGNTYCRKNGEFFRHLKKYGFASYQDFFDATFPNHIQTCSCGACCSFDPHKMQYLQSCGNRSCVGKVTSSIKQNFSDSQWATQKRRYQETMAEKEPAEIASVQEQRKRTNLTKYGVNHPWKSTEIRKKIQETMQRKYGTNNFSSTLIPSASKILLEDREWLYEQHINKQRPLYEIGHELNVGDRTVGIYLHRHDIPTQHFQRSMWERELEAFLKQHSVTTVVNTTEIIPPKELDFFLPDFNIAIELCGLYWHSSKHERITKTYHQQKQEECLKKGIRLLTIFEDEWEKKEIIFSKLKHLLHLPHDKVYARNTTIVYDVCNDERKRFLETYHIQGNGRGSVTVTLTHKDEVVALALFTTQSQHHFILSRYATSVHVVGGFSKIMCAFETQYDCKTIKTFADKRWSIGELYEKNGFHKDAILPPDYAYIRNGHRVHKFNYRHEQLKRKLPHYDPCLSERDNCVAHGIYRVWDCGKIRYIKHVS